MLEISDVLTILTILLGVGASYFKLVRWMTTKIDSELSSVHKRIDDVKDTYVKRVDLDRDLTNLYSMLNSIKDDIHAQTASVNLRLDRFLDAIIKQQDKQ